MIRLASALAKAVSKGPGGACHPWTLLLECEGKDMHPRKTLCCHALLQTTQSTAESCNAVTVVVHRTEKQEAGGSTITMLASTPTHRPRTKNRKQKHRRGYRLRSKTNKLTKIENRKALKGSLCWIPQTPFIRRSGGLRKHTDGWAVERNHRLRERSVTGGTTRRRSERKRGNPIPPTDT